MFSLDNRQRWLRLIRTRYMGKVWISRAACLNDTPWHVIAVIPLSLAGAA